MHQTRGAVDVYTSVIRPSMLEAVGHAAQDDPIGRGAVKVNYATDAAHAISVAEKFRYILHVLSKTPRGKVAEPLRQFGLGFLYSNGGRGLHGL